MNKVLLLLIILFAVMIIHTGCKKNMTDIDGNLLENQADYNQNQKIITGNFDKFAYKNNNHILDLTGKDDNNLNIYKSNKYKFEIKLPEYFEKDISNSLEHENADWFFNRSIPAESQTHLFIEVEENTNRIKEVKSREEYINLFGDVEDSLIYRLFRKFKVNNYDVFKIEEAGGIQDISVSYYLIFKDYIYKFSYSIDIYLNDIENYKKEKEKSVISALKTFMRIY